MGEGLLARARRVVEAGVGSVVETAERLTGPSLMRQAIRDVEHAVDDARRHGAKAERRAVQAGERARLAGERAQKLTEEARFALNAGREDLAEAALVQKRASEVEAADAAAAQAAARDEAARLHAVVNELVGRQRALEEEYRAHEIVASAPGQPLAPGLDGRVTRAEQSFARARSAVDGAILGAERAGGSSEVDALRRDQDVADELAAMKAELELPAGPVRPRRRS